MTIAKTERIRRVIPTQCLAFNSSENYHLKIKAVKKAARDTKARTRAELMPAARLKLMIIKRFKYSANTNTALIATHVTIVLLTCLSYIPKM